MPSPWTAPYGEWRAWTLSKSSGTALILIMRSLSSAVRRLIFARLKFVFSIKIHRLLTTTGNYLFWNQTCTCRGLRPGISLDNRSLWAASGCGCFANSLMRNRVCWWVSLEIVSPVPVNALLSHCLPESFHLSPRCSSFGRRHLLQCRFGVTVDHVILIYHFVVILLLGHLILLARLAGR